MNTVFDLKDLPSVKMGEKFPMPLKDGSVIVMSIGSVFEQDGIKKGIVKIHHMFQVELWKKLMVLCILH